MPNSGKLSQLAQKAFPMSNMIENILVCDGSPGLAESGASRLLSDDAKENSERGSSDVEWCPCVHRVQSCDPSSVIVNNKINFNLQPI